MSKKETVIETEYGAPVGRVLVTTVADVMEVTIELNGRVCSDSWTPHKREWTLTEMIREKTLSGAPGNVVFVISAT